MIEDRKMVYSFQKNTRADKWYWRRSQGSFKVKRRVLDARLRYLAFDVDDLSTFFQKFATDAMEKLANFAADFKPVV